MAGVNQLMYVLPYAADVECVDLIRFKVSVVLVVPSWLSCSTNVNTYKATTNCKVFTVSLCFESFPKKK